MSNGGVGACADWVSDTADRVAAAADRRGLTGPIVCASGISPSGHIHLGNLREVMVPHLVADELRRRGRTVRHLLSWDDYDRFRKVPAGAPQSFEEYIGRPLVEVPDPTGGDGSWAEHFKAPFRAALQQLGVEVDEISQADAYRAGTYRSQVLRAMEQRSAIHDVLAEYRTSKDADPTDDAPELDTGGESFSPYRAYCRVCGRDSTSMVAYDDATTEFAYSCECGHDDAFRLDSVHHGKLVWKVDWPMRWAFEQVAFEAGGADHSSPGSSFTVGSRVVGSIFGGEPPEYLQYSFVGTDGAGKMSGSTGSGLTPLAALEIIEPSVLRSLYCREPRKSFSVAFNEKVANSFDEWDRLSRRIETGTAEPRDRAVHARSVATASVEIPVPAIVVPFRSLASVVDVTNGDPDQLRRVLARMVLPSELSSLDEMQPRLACAVAWVAKYLPPAERTHILEQPDQVLLDGLDQRQRDAIDLLVDGLDAAWNLDDLTDLVYGIPKQQLGLDVHERTNSPELREAQRAFFTLIYRLLVGSDTGPRIPTLLLAIGQDRIRSLVAAGPASPTDD